MVERKERCLETAANDLVQRTVARNILEDKLVMVCVRTSERNTRVAHDSVDNMDNETKKS